MSIVLLSEVMDIRARKARELAFYTEKKHALEVRLANIRRELNLTDTILALIRREELIDFFTARTPHS
jgi:hypothetical protein